MAAAVRSSDQFLCSICLEVFTEPVSTTCGHNFCKTCITEAWNTSAPCRCPLCNKRFNKRPELSVNTLFSDMVSQFRSDLMKQWVHLSEVSKPGEVSCDMCTDPKLKALKSCLVCLASYCDTHLQPHLTVSGLKRHQLMEPLENLEDRMCPKHDKPLELFCRTDHSCVCTMCSLLDHQSHKFISLKEEVDLRRSSLQQTQAQTQLMVEQRSLKIKEVQDSLKLSQQAVDRETVVGLQVFTALIQSVQRRQDQFIAELQVKHRQSQKQAQDLIQELELEICELEKRSSEVEELSRSEDHLYVIQQSTLQRPAADLKDWSTLSFETHTFEGSAARAVSELEETLTEEFNKVFNTELKRVQQFAVYVTLDPDTAHPALVLSEDLKQVHYTDLWKNVRENPKRFDASPNVLGKQRFSSRRFYFEVQVKEKTDWDLGVVQESINRKGQINLSPKKGYWTMCLRNKYEYKAGSSPPVPLSPCPLDVLLRRWGYLWTIVRVWSPFMT